MLHLLEIYRAQFQTTLAVLLQYRVAQLIWLIGQIIQPVVYLTVWLTVAQSQGGEVGDFSQAELAAYFIASMMINHLTFTWHMWEYDFRIREGLLSPLLLRPLHPIHVDLAENISHKLLTLIVILPVAILLALIFKPAYDAPLWSYVAFLPALLIAFLDQFLLGWALAMLAFWTTRIAAINRMYFLGKLFLAGQVAPLALLPPLWQTIAAVSPFRYMVAFPIELLLGQLTPYQALAGMTTGALWVIVALIAVKLVWRAGIRRYSAFGA